MVMLGCELFKRMESNTSYNQEFLFAIKHKSMSRDFRLCMTCPFHVCFRNTLKKSYKRPPHILSSSSESKIRSIKIHDHMNKPMSNSGSVSFCIPKCVILLTQTKHV